MTSRYRRPRGFTLTELIISFAIIAMIATATAITFGHALTRSTSKAAPVLLAAVDAAARQAAVENPAGLAFPVIEADCATSAPGTTLSVASTSFTAGTSTDSTTVSACVASASDTLYLAVRAGDGTCDVLVDTLVASQLPPQVQASTTTSTAAASTGAHYGADPSSADPCSAPAVYAFVAGGGQVTSTDSGSPSTVSL